MAKKKQTNEEEIIETADTLIVENEPKDDKPKTKSDNVKKDEKRTLIDLVNSSNISRLDIISKLCGAELLNQFYTEEKKYNDGEYIEPSLTETEFKKIIK